MMHCSLLFPGLSLEEERNAAKKREASEDEGFLWEETDFRRKSMIVSVIPPSSREVFVFAALSSTRPGNTGKCQKNDGVCEKGSSFRGGSGK
jgi:hypothetical protein